MTSIITNTSAMTALQTLKTINSNLASAQDEVSTGKTVSSAKDNAAIWSITKVMESDVSGIDSIETALDLGSSTVSVATKASETVVETLKEIQSLVVNAQAGNIDKETLQTQIDNKIATIGQTISSAQVNGMNLLDNSQTSDVKVLAALNRAADGTVTTDSITIEPKQLAAVTYSSSGNTVDYSAGELAGLENMDVTADAEAALASITSILSKATAAASYYGAKEEQINAQSAFMSTLSDAMTTGIGTLTDADMEEASARLTALQTQQQLGIQALSIANQSTQNILSLFQ